MKYIQIGKQVIPLWILGIVSVAGVSLLAYTLLTVTIPLEVKAPLEILHYPSKLSLYPGETEYFNVTVQNHASQYYSVFLNCSTDNATYEENYVSFSNETYVVHPGVQNLTAWLKVSADALSTDATLTVNLHREADELTYPFLQEQLQIQVCTFSGTSGDNANTIVLTVQNTGNCDLTVDKYKLGVNGTTHDIADVLVDEDGTADVTCTTGADGEAWISGTKYDICLITSTGKQFQYKTTAP